MQSLRCTADSLRCTTDYLRCTTDSLRLSAAPSVPTSFDSEINSPDENVNHFLTLINITNYVDFADLDKFKAELLHQITDHQDSSRSSKFMDINDDRIKLSPIGNEMHIRILKNVQSIPSIYLSGNYQYGIPVGVVSNLTFSDFNNLTPSRNEIGHIYPTTWNHACGATPNKFIHPIWQELGALICDGKIPFVPFHIDQINAQLLKQSTQRTRSFRLPIQHVATMAQLAHITQSNMAVFTECRLGEFHDGILIEGLFINRKNEDEYSIIGFVPDLTFSDFVTEKNASVLDQSISNVPEKEEIPNDSLCTIF